MGNLFLDNEKNLKSILDNEINNEVLIADSYLMITILKSKEICSCSWGGELLISYIRHIVNRLSEKGELSPAFLGTIARIYMFVKDVNNVQFLEKTGMIKKKIMIAKKLCATILRDERWYSCILDELDKCSLEDYEFIKKVCKLCAINICGEVLKKAKKKEELSWRYLSYIIDFGDGVQCDKAVEMFAEKADIVNIRYPMDDCDEYIFLMKFYKSGIEYKNEYQNVLELGLSSNNVELFINASEAIVRWNPELLNIIDTDKINNFKSSDDVDEEKKEKLDMISKIINEHEGLTLEI